MGEDIKDQEQKPVEGRQGDLLGTKEQVTR